MGFIKTFEEVEDEAQQKTKKGKTKEKEALINSGNKRRKNKNHAIHSQEAD